MITASSKPPSIIKLFLSMRESLYLPDKHSLNFSPFPLLLAFLSDIPKIIGNNTTQGKSKDSESAEQFKYSEIFETF